MTRVTYLRVEDRGYPRNQLLRNALVEAGHDVEVIDRISDGPKPLRLLRDFGRGLVGSKGSDVVIVPEFSLPFVPAAWLIAKLRGATLVVDGFVGKYETVIEDWEKASPRSLTALFCRAVDRIALTLSDMFLIDTDMRADVQRSRARRGTDVFTLPVGSPDWIRPVPPPAHEGGLRVLYTGGALPLHGVPFLFRGLAKTKNTSTTLTLIFAVAPERFPYFRALIDELGIADRCHFLDQTSHRELIETVQRHDVVVGVFGDSPKARSVLANKVWQGLASSRTVVTRSTPALAEIAPAAGGLLISVEDEDELAAALDELADRAELPYDPEITNRLDAYVRSRYAEFITALDTRTG